VCGKGWSFARKLLDLIDLLDATSFAPEHIHGKSFTESDQCFAVFD
jgi:hypothetical protein